MSLYSAQRTNFQPAMPRLATEPGQQRQTFPRSKNRGKKNPVENMRANQQMLLKLAQFKSSGVI